MRQAVCTSSISKTIISYISQDMRVEGRKEKMETDPQNLAKDAAGEITLRHK